MITKELFYNLDNDPEEVTNLSSDSKYFTTIKNFQFLLEQEESAAVIYHSKIISKTKKI